MEPTPNKSPQYIIPPYQRPYAWKKEEIFRFFQTIIKDYMEGQPAFMGTFQFMPDGDKMQVVDGQQRLTTLYLFFHYLKLHHKTLYKELAPPPNEWLLNTVSQGKEQEALRALVAKQAHRRQEQINRCGQHVLLFMLLLLKIFVLFSSPLPLLFSFVMHRRQE